MIVVFDSQCLICSAWVHFLLKYDKKRKFRFASIQGNTGQSLVKDQHLKLDNLDTMLLVDGVNVYQHTDAILRVLVAMEGFWKIFVLIRLIPAMLRDPIYRFVARNRYKLLGRKDVCFVPSPADRERFLD